MSTAAPGPRCPSNCEVTIACTFSQINLVSGRLPVQGSSVCVGTLCATMSNRAECPLRAYGANCQLTAKPSTSPASRRGQLNQNTKRKPKKVVTHWQWAGSQPGTATTLATHRFYLLIRTLCCFYLIFMPGAIFISVIELSLSRPGQARPCQARCCCFVHLLVVG